MTLTLWNLQDSKDDLNKSLKIILLKVNGKGNIYCMGKKYFPGVIAERFSSAVFKMSLMSSFRRQMGD